MRFMLFTLAIAAGFAISASATDEVEGAPIGSAATSETSEEPAPSLEDLVTSPSPGNVERDIFGAPLPKKNMVELEEEQQEIELERTKDGTHLKLNFTLLSDFDYIMPDPYAATPIALPKNQIPSRIMDLGGEDTLIVGYMMPVEVNKAGEILRFILVRDQSLCCFGVTPAINEWIDVVVNPETPVKFFADLPIAVYGEFEVGEVMEDGYVLSIYRINASRVIDVRELMKEEAN